MKKPVTICLIIAGFLMATLAYAGQDIKVRVNGGMLHGTIEIPSGEVPCPVALIISGSGPTDRDGNNPLMGGKNNSLKLLAEALASNGIASVRYDKRGIGESAQAMTKEEDLRFETYIEDAVVWGKELQKNKQFSQVAIIGHSEGSLIGLVACQKMNADAFVSIAGAGIPASNLFLSQLKLKLPKDLFENAETIIDQLNLGKAADPVPPTLNALFRKSVQPYLISWFRYNPAKEVSKLKIPILIVHGSTDIQMDIDNANVLAKSNGLAKQTTINGMNHILKKVSDNLQEQISSYGDPSLPIAEELVEEITTFMMSVETTRPNKNMH
ncbi:MAG: alpha/beta hydrolase [Desulfobacterales bacterium]